MRPAGHRPRCPRARPVRPRPQSRQLSAQDLCSRRAGADGGARHPARRLHRHLDGRDHYHALAAMRPRAVAAAILNDVGPAIAPEGIARILSYVGKRPAFAAGMMRRPMSGRPTPPPCPTLATRTGTALPSAPSATGRTGRSWTMIRRSRSACKPPSRFPAGSPACCSAGSPANARRC